MVIDAHVKLGASYTGKHYTAADYIKEMERNGIERALICPQKPPSYQVEDGNDEIEAMLAAHPDKFYGAVRIDPWKREKALDELAKRFANPQFKAIHLHPWEEHFQCNNEIIYPVMQFAQERGIPVVVEAGYPWMSHISQIADLAGHYPTVKILATNAGQLDLSGLTLSEVNRLLKKHDNLYLGTSSAVAAEWLADLIQKGVPDRMLFESNYPFTQPYMEIFRITHGYIGEDDKRRVLKENIGGFLGL